MNLQQIEYKANAEFKNMLQDELTIAKMQQHVNAKSQYYAVLGEMFSKYFIQDQFGNIRYIQAAFEIERFEEAYKVIARSLLYIKTAMTRKYGYTSEINFITEESDSTIEEFSEIQKAAKSEYDLLKSKSMLDIIGWVSKDRIYNILNTRDYETVKLSDEIEEDDIGLHLGFNSDNLDGKFVLSYNRKHKVMFHESLKIALKLRRLYKENTVNEIMKTCTNDNGIVKRIEVNRYLNLVKLMFDDRKSMLAGHTREMLSIAYDFVDPMGEKQKLDRWEFEDMKSQLRFLVEKNVRNITEEEFRSERRKNTVDGLISKFIDTLFKKRVSKDTVSIEFRKVFQFDSAHINEKIQRDKIFNQLLYDDYTDIDPNQLHDISEEHIDDGNQFSL